MMDFVKNEIVDVAVEIMQEAISLAHTRFPEDIAEEVIEGMKSAFSTMKLSGEVLTAEGLIALYQRQRT